MDMKTITATQDSSNFNEETIISASYAAKQRNSSSKLLNRERNGGHLQFSGIDKLKQSGHMIMFTLTLTNIIYPTPCYRSVSSAIDGYILLGETHLRGCVCSQRLLCFTSDLDLLRGIIDLFVFFSLESSLEPYYHSSSLLHRCLLALV